MPLLLPKGKKRTALLRKLKVIFRALSLPAREGVIEKINPILRGWVQYFAAGHSSRCFSYIRTGWRRGFGAIWREHVSAQASGGSGGAGNGCMARWGSLRVPSAYQPSISAVAPAGSVT